MPLPSDRPSLLNLAAETERILEETLDAEDGGDAPKRAMEVLRLARIRFELGELREAERLYEESATAFWALGSTRKRDIAALARLNQAGIAMRDGRSQEALAILEHVIEQEDSFPELLTVPKMRFAFLEVWLFLLVEAGDPQKIYDATAIALALLYPADPTTDPLVLAAATLRRAKAAEALGHIDEAVDVYERAITQLDAIDPAKADPYLVEAMLRVAFVLGNHERYDEMEAAVTRIVERLGARTEPHIQQAVIGAQAYLDASDEDAGDD